MLGKGKGFLLILVLSFLKSIMNLTVLSFLGIIVEGACHSESLICLRTPISQSLSSSNLSVSLLETGTGYGLQATGGKDGSFSSI